jgi:flagellar biosynthetic protein FliR
MVAPVFGASYVPARLRLIMAGAITLLVAPLLPLPAVPLLSGAGLVIAVKQLLIGVAIGFVLQVVFDALAMGGQLLANTMGLSFAFNVDPLRGTSAPVVGQFYTLVATLTFLALDGHLAVVQALFDGFATMPVDGRGIGPDGLWQIANWGTALFRGALMVALPGLTALLIVNLAFGVVSRAAPSLNLFAIGFPVTLIGGLLIIWAGLPSMQAGFVKLMREAFGFAAALTGGG